MIKNFLDKYFRSDFLCSTKTDAQHKFVETRNGGRSLFVRYLSKECYQHYNKYINVYTMALVRER